MPVPRVMQELMRNGILAAINERIDFDTASILAEDLGFRAEREEGTKEMDTEGVDKIRNRAEGENPEDLQRRPPVIVVMFHLDH